jgi:hypothetical protein
MRPQLPVILLFALLWHSAAARPIDDHMTLVEAIDEVRAEGIEIVYSSRLVEEWMLVRETPADDEPIEALRTALAAYQLDLEQGPGGKWLIVKSDQRRTPAEFREAPAPLAHRPTLAQLPIEEITIVGSRHSMYEPLKAAGQFLSGDDIRLMPHIADDAMRAMHRLPGVAASDFKAPFNLRGGAVDEVQLRLDGIEIFEPFHMRTLYQPLSVIDPGIIGNAQVLSGAFMADYGNYMSGVIDLNSRQPTPRPVHELGVSFVSAFARSSGQFDNGRGSYLVSARRGYLDLIAAQVVDPNEELQPRYGDLFGRLSYSVNDVLDLSLHTMLANDDVSFVDPNDGEDFGENGTMSHIWVTAEFEPAPGISSATAAFSSRVDSTENGVQIDEPGTNISRYFHQATEYSGLRSDWQVTADSEHTFRFGARYRDVSSDYDYRLDSTRHSDFVDNGAPISLLRSIQESVDGQDLGVYGAYRLRASNRLALEAGLRWDQQDYGDAGSRSQVSPRLNALLQISDRAELRLGWGRYYQPQAIQDLQVPDGDLQFYDAELADHVTVGLNYTFANDWALQADAYDKRYRELRPHYENLLDPYEFAPESNFDRTVIDPESGHAYGVELTLQGGASESLNWWLSYTWSKVQDEIGEVTVLRSWDQRNALTASLTWHGEKWTFSAIGRYHSGWPRTPLIVTPVTDSGGNLVGIDIDLSARNTQTFNDYSRVDLRVSRKVPLERGSFEYYLEVFNVFDISNQCCTSGHSLSFGPSVSASPQYDDYLPLFPSFGFVWKFGPGASE